MFTVANWEVLIVLTKARGGYYNHCHKWLSVLSSNFYLNLKNDLNVFILRGF